MALEQSNISGLFYFIFNYFFFPSLGFLQFKKMNTHGLQKDDDFCMSCHLPAHISRSEILTFLPNFISLLGQAPRLFVSPNEHHFTFDGYWIDHGLWWLFIFIALPPNRLWGLFESAHALFEVRFIEWGEKEEMLWGFRAGELQWSLRCSLF